MFGIFEGAEIKAERDGTGESTGLVKVPTQQTGAFVLPERSHETRAGTHAVRGTRHADSTSCRPQSSYE